MAVRESSCVKWGCGIRLVLVTLWLASGTSYAPVSDVAAVADPTQERTIAVHLDLETLAGATISELPTDELGGTRYDMVLPNSITLSSHGNGQSISLQTLSFAPEMRTAPVRLQELVEASQPGKGVVLRLEEPLDVVLDDAAADASGLKAVPRSIQSVTLVLDKHSHQVVAAHAKLSPLNNDGSPSEVEPLEVDLSQEPYPYRNANAIQVDMDANALDDMWIAISAEQLSVATFEGPNGTGPYRLTFVLPIHVQIGGHEVAISTIEFNNASTSFADPLATLLRSTFVSPASVILMKERGEPETIARRMNGLQLIVDSNESHNGTQTLLVRSDRIRVPLARVEDYDGTLATQEVIHLDIGNGPLDFSLATLYSDEAQDAIENGFSAQQWRDRFNLSEQTADVQRAEVARLRSARRRPFLTRAATRLLLATAIATSLGVADELNGTNHLDPIAAPIRQFEIATAQAAYRWVPDEAKEFCAAFLSAIAGE